MMNFGVIMFKPVIVAKKSWWVPERNSDLLAVQINQPEEYQQAVRWKMETLAQEWGLDRALASANQYLREDGGLELPQPEDEEQLVQFVLENNSRLLEMVSEGDPSVSKPADPKLARITVRHHQSLNWEDFLTAGGATNPGTFDSFRDRDSTDELAGLSDLDLDKIFDALGGVKNSNDGATKDLGSIAKKLKGLSIEDLLQEMDKASDDKSRTTSKSKQKSK